MASYSVAEAKNRLPSLIDKALEGEDVVITRHGKPVAELRARGARAADAPRSRPQIYEWLKAQREALKPLDIDSVKLLNELNDEGAG
jgi:antitoxin (DNA-binding transcriptional repressor) of toxin-antitoxin stability system